jgi:hypothetical protein
MFNEPNVIQHGNRFGHQWNKINTNKKKLLIYSTGNLWLIHVKNVGVKQAIVERADHTA